MNAYNTSFYDTIREGIQRSAEALVPILLERIEFLPRSGRLIDVGCGEGWWAAEFEKHGFEVEGIDGDYHYDHMLGDRFHSHHLADPLPDLGHFDVAVCLEVAEHLRPDRAESFISELCGLADWIIFSAAIPSQGGTMHLNEQWPDYWTKLFNDNGCAVDDSLRFDIWNDERIENWYRQNLLIVGRGWSQGPMPLSVVHPVLWKAYR